MAAHSEPSINPEVTPPSTTPSMKPSRLELSLVALMMASCSGFFYFHPASLEQFFGQIDSGKIFELFAYLTIGLLVLWCLGYVCRVRKSAAFVIFSIVVSALIITAAGMAAGWRDIALALATVVFSAAFALTYLNSFNLNTWFIPLIVVQGFMLYRWFIPSNKRFSPHLHHWRALILLMMLSVPICFSVTFYSYPHNIVDEFAFNDHYYYLVVSEWDDVYVSTLYECNSDALDCESAFTFSNQWFESSPTSLAIDTAFQLIYVFSGEEIKAAYHSGSVERPIRLLFRLEAWSCRQGFQNLC
jgi:hypothetical protein